MNFDERRRCIHQINPNARCSVWANGTIKYDELCHVGSKPTLKECEAVLPAIQEQIALEKEEQLNEEKIQAKIRELAIESLKAGGELPKDYK